MKNLIYLNLSIFLSSCGFYSSTSINAPLFTEKGQIAITATAGSGFNFQGAYAISNHMAVLANTSNYEIEGSFNNGRDLSAKGFGKTNEIALGYFTKKKDGTYLEIFGGFGHIVTKNTISYRVPCPENAYCIFQNALFNINANKYFIQPSVGWAGKNVELAFTARIANLQYSNQVSQLPDSVFRLSKYDRLTKYNYPLIEPGITLRIGTKYVKFQGQILFSFDKGKVSMPENTGGNISIGLFSKFPTKAKK
jgi:hypothetical protein